MFSGGCREHEGGGSRRCSGRCSQGRVHLCCWKHHADRNRIRRMGQAPKRWASCVSFLFVAHSLVFQDHRDFKAESLAKYGTPESGELRRQGLAADVFFTSVTAISQEGMVCRWLFVCLFVCLFFFFFFCASFSRMCKANWLPSI
jgi:hypothetical protein